MDDLDLLVALKRVGEKRPGLLGSMRSADQDPVWAGDRCSHMGRHHGGISEPALIKRAFMISLIGISPGGFSVSD